MPDAPKAQPAPVPSASPAHLYHNKHDFAGLLRRTPSHEHPALAKQHGWQILDLTCACGLKVPDHLVDTRSSVSDDLRVKPCPKCGARGQWKSAPAVKPAAPPPAAAPGA